MNGTKSTISIAVNGLATLALVGLLVLQVQSRADAREATERQRALTLEPRFEYKVVVFVTTVQRSGEDALKPAAIQVDEQELSRLGAQGWEIVDSFLELETAFPNFGNDKYVTGLRENVRPQRLVLLLRHRLG